MTRLARLVLLVLLAVLVSIPTAARADCLLECPPVVDPNPPDPDPEPPPGDPDPEPPPEPEPDHPVDLSAEANQLLALVNGERHRARLAPLVADVAVTDIAARHSARMAEAGSIWHNESYFTAATKERISAARLGENVASNTNVEEAHRRLMASPGHRANILDAGFDMAGFAVFRGSKGTIYVTEAFAQRSHREKLSATAAETVHRRPIPATTAAPEAKRATAESPSGAEPVASAIDATGEPVELAWSGEAAAPARRDQSRRDTPVLLITAAALLLLGCAAGAIRTRARRAPLAALPQPCPGR